MFSSRSHILENRRRLSYTNFQTGILHWNSRGQKISVNNKFTHNQFSQQDFSVQIVKTSSFNITIKCKSSCRRQSSNWAYFKLSELDLRSSEAVSSPHTVPPPASPYPHCRQAKGRLKIRTRLPNWHQALLINPWCYFVIWFSLFSCKYKFEWL